MQLVVPSEQYEQAYRDALIDAQRDQTESDLARPEEDQSFAQFVQMYRDRAAGRNLPDDIVPETMLWLMDNGELIGRVSIRHELNEYLAHRGGNIGYYIRPSKRGMGYGNKILELALIEARKIGLKKALLSCDDTNAVSCKIIEKTAASLSVLSPMTPNMPHSGGIGSSYKIPPPAR